MKIRFMWVSYYSSFLSFFVLFLSECGNPRMIKKVMRMPGDQTQ